MRHRTPLRYPGGKQRLAPFIRELLVANALVGGHYVEPYAGGAGVAMELLLDGCVSHVHLNDSSLPIYLFWKSMLHFSDDMCRLILGATLDVDEWKKRREIVRNPKDYSELEVGYSAFYLNRCNRSGVLSGGLIGGLSQAGKWKMDARFPRNELVRRIEAIAAKSSHISLSNGDAEEYIVEYVTTLPDNTLVYCDPPYFEKSHRLYLNHYRPADHARVADTIQNRLKVPWVVSYDNAQEVRSYYEARRSFVYSLQYNADRAYKGREIFIFSDDVVVPSSSKLSFINEAIQTAAKC